MVAFVYVLDAGYPYPAILALELRLDRALLLDERGSVADDEGEVRLPNLFPRHLVPEVSRGLPVARKRECAGGGLYENEVRLDRCTMTGDGNGPCQDDAVCAEALSARACSEGLRFRMSEDPCLCQ